MKHIHIPHWHRGLHALHFGLLNGLVAVVFVATIGFSVLSPTWVQQADAAVSSFSSSSFWNTPVPAYTSLHPDSTALAANIAAQSQLYGNSFDTTNSSAVYTVDANTPLVSVVPWDCGAGSLPDLINQWLAVPVPFFAVPGSGPNGKMVIHQPSTSTVWEFGHMRNVAGQWQACTGGRTSTAGDGVFPSPYGISSSGLAQLGGQLNAEEIRSGYIDHAIGLGLPQTNSHVFPATQSNGAQIGAPALGMRLRLDPSLNIQSLGLSAAGTAIARAAQTYGFIVWNSSGSVSVSGENPVAQTSRGLADPYSSLGVNSALNNFPWDKLQVMPTGVNYATAIPAITEFSSSQSTVQADSTVTLRWKSANVNRCVLPGLSDNLPANGSYVTKPLKGNITFVLRCGGPTGAASSQLSVAVIPLTQNDFKPLEQPAVVIDQPYSGYANIMPELMTLEAADKVYKVVYYEKSTYLYETAKPPYALNTARLDNGHHAVDAQIYYRDGTTDKKSIGLTVSNTPETLFATVQSGTIMAPTAVPLPYLIIGSLIALSGMGIGSWWGWRKAHLV